MSSQVWMMKRAYAALYGFGAHVMYHDRVVSLLLRSSLYGDEMLCDSVDAFMLMINAD